MIKKFLIIWSLISFFASNLLSQSSSIAGLTVEQDIFLNIPPINYLNILNEDRNYTMGIAFTLPRKKPRCLFKPLRTIDKVMWGFDYEDESNDMTLTAQSLNLGGTGFTPRYLGEAIDSIDKIVNDRPFAGIIFIQVQKTKLDVSKLRSSSLIYGLYGTHIPKAVQGYMHEQGWGGGDRIYPNGWNNQISNGGEFTFLYTVNWKELQTPSALESLKDHKLFDFYQNIELRIGYYTGVKTELGLKFGLLDPRNWFNTNGSILNSASGLYSNQLIDQRIKSIGSPPKSTVEMATFTSNINYLDYLKEDYRYELYLFLNPRLNYYLYNGFLQGQFRNNFHDLSYSEISPLVAEFDFGLGMTIPLKNKCWDNKQFDAVQIAAIVSGRSPEFKLSMARSHFWAGFQAYYIFF